MTPLSHTSPSISEIVLRRPCSRPLACIRGSGGLSGGNMVKMLCSSFSGLDVGMFLQGSVTVATWASRSGPKVFCGVCWEFGGSRGFQRDKCEIGFSAGGLGTGLWIDLFISFQLNSLISWEP